jgi:hypothetical protein
MTEELIDESRVADAGAPEVETIWLTRPSVKPFVLAAALMLTLIGLFAFRPLMIVAIVVALVTALKWIGDSRAESDELPLA